jgi:hypothetical protein
VTVTGGGDPGAASQGRELSDFWKLHCAAAVALSGNRQRPPVVNLADNPFPSDADSVMEPARPRWLTSSSVMPA